MQENFLFCLCSVPAVMQNSNTLNVADGINPWGTKTDCVYFFSCMTLPPIYSKTQLLQFSLNFRFFIARACRCKLDLPSFYLSFLCCNVSFPENFELGKKCLKTLNLASTSCLPHHINISHFSQPFNI